MQRHFLTSKNSTSHHQPITSEAVILCRSVGTLALSGRLRTIQKAVLHEACHSGPLAGLAAGRGARGDAVMSALRMHMSELRGHHTVPVLVVVASKLASDHFPKENNVKLTLVLCGAALRGSGSQQRSGREATNALRCGQRRQRQAQQGQTQHV